MGAAVVRVGENETVRERPLPQVLWFSTDDEYQLRA
jgi:hypothetical protein